MRKLRENEKNRPIPSASYIKKKILTGDGHTVCDCRLNSHKHDHILLHYLVSSMHELMQNLLFASIISVKDYYLF